MRRKFPIIFLIVAFLINTVGSVPTQASELLLPNPGMMVHLSPEYNPLILKGIKINPKNPFQFDFILDQGDSVYANYSSGQFKTEATRLVKYFLASLTIPDSELWVNLSPYEKNRVIPISFSRTEMGRDLLAEDYMLKQITASLIYPEDEIGKRFWKRIYEEAFKKFGTTNVPVSTFNKVWIVPQKAVVYENAKTNTAYVVETKLKVMLEQDYLSLKKHQHQLPITGASALGSQIIREIVIPELTKEVNTNKNFAQLRQVYNSLILASWLKNKMRNSILARGYVGQKKVAGVQYDKSVIRNVSGPISNDTDRIYQRYLQAFKKGVYNFIKEEVDLTTNETIPRKYFSGGMKWDDVSRKVEEEKISGPDAAQMVSKAMLASNLIVMTAGLSATYTDKAGKKETVNLDALKNAAQIASSMDDAQLKAFNKKSADYVKGESSLSKKEIEESVAQNIVEFHHAGHGAFIQERILAYRKLLEPANRIYTALSPQATAVEKELGEARSELKEGQLQRIQGLLDVMQNTYLALEPLEAINKLEVLPFKIRAASNIHLENVSDLAREITDAKEEIENTLFRFYWDGDSTFFNQPIAIKILDQMSKASENAVAFNADTHEIQIGLNALSLEHGEFVRQFQEALFTALVDRITVLLTKRLGVNNDEQFNVKEAISDLARSEKSLSEFILFCNIGHDLSWDNVRKYLTHEESLESLLGQDQEIIEEAEVVYEKKVASDNRFFKAFRRIFSYLQQHPALAVIPLAIIALAGATQAADFNHAGNHNSFNPHPGGNLPQANPGLVPNHQPLVLDHVLRLRSESPDVMKIGSALVEHVNEHDIQALTGNNSVTGNPYDSHYLSKNAGRIIQGAISGIHQGVYNTDVQTIVVAFQHAHGLAEDGSIGNHVLGALNQLSGSSVSGSGPPAGPPSGPPHGPPPHFAGISHTTQVAPPVISSTPSVQNNLQSNNVNVVNSSVADYQTSINEIFTQRQDMINQLKTAMADQNVAHFNPEQLAQYQARIRAGDNYLKIQERLFVNTANQPAYIVGSLDPDDLHKEVRSFPDVDTFTKMIYNNPTIKIRLFKSPSNTIDPLQLADLLKHPELELVSQAEIRQYNESGRPFIVYIDGKDEKGDFNGVLWAGTKAAQESASLAAAIAKDRLYTEKVLNITNITDLKSQQEAILEAIQEGLIKDNVGIPHNGKLAIAVEVSRDAMGNITGVERFLTAEDIKTSTYGSKSILTVTTGNEVKELRIWGHNLDQVLTIFTMHDVSESPNAIGKVSDNTIILGSNYSRVEDIKVREGIYLAEQEQQAINRYKNYLKHKIVLEALLVPVNIFTQSVVPITPLANLAFDFLTHPNRIMPKAPSDKEWGRFFGEYILAIHPEYNNLTRAEIEAKGLEYIKSLRNEEDADKLRQWLEKRKGENTADYILGMIAQTMQLGGETLGATDTKIGSSLVVVNKPGLGFYYDAFKEPRNGALVDILSQKYIGLNGSINVPELTALAVTGKALRPVGLNQMISSSANIVEKFFNVVGVSVDGRSAINQLFGHGQTDKVFDTAPSKLRIHPYVLGFDFGLLGEKKLYDNLSKIVNDPNAYAYEIEEGLMSSKAHAYNRTDFDKLYLAAGNNLVPAGKIVLDGRNLQVPVYYIAEPQANGHSKLRVFIVTEAGLKINEARITRDLQAYDNYSKIMQEGGYVRNIGFLGGTYNQNYPTGLFLSHDQQGQVFSADGYTWDQMLIVKRALLSNDVATARQILKFYKDTYNVINQKGKNGFPGFATSYNVITGQPMGNFNERDIASNASIGTMIMAYEQYMLDHGTPDNQFSSVKGAVFNWLDQMHKQYGAGGLQNLPNDSEKLTGKYAEPNAIVWSFMDQYARNTNSPQAQKIADDILHWVTTQMHGDNFIKNAQGQEGSSLDAQTRWLEVLGPQRFMTAFGMTPQSFAQYLRSIEGEFNPDRQMSLFDLADTHQAKVTRDGLRIGFPEVTAEMVYVYQSASQFFAAQNMDQEAQEFDANAKFYRQGLENSKGKDGYLPQAVVHGANKREGISSGYGYNVAIGDRSIGPMAQYDISVTSGENTFSSPQGQNVLAPMARSTHALSRDDLEKREVVFGVDQRNEVRSRIDGLVEGQKRGEKNSLIYADPVNEMEAVIVNDDGLAEHIVLLASQQEVTDHLKRSLENIENGRQYTMALKGEGNYYHGAVVFNRKIINADGGVTVGEAIPDAHGVIIRDSKVKAQVFDYINHLPLDQRMAISSGKFANFTIPLKDLGLGDEDQVFASVIFPVKGADVIELNNSGKSEIHSYDNQGLQRLTVTGNKVTSIEYNQDRLNAGAQTYDLPHDLRANIAQMDDTSDAFKEYLSKVQEFLLTGPQPVEVTRTVGIHIPVPGEHIKADQVTRREVKLNVITGETSLQEYSIYEQPIRVITNDLYTVNDFTAEGRPTGSKIYTNKNGDFNNGAAGALQFIDTVKEWSPDQMTVDRQDVVFGIGKTIVRDSINDGRTVLETYTDSFINPLGNRTTIDYKVVPQYSDDYYNGRIPYTTLIYNANTGKLIKTINTIHFDYKTRITVVDETDVRTRSVVRKTVEPVFGQSLTESHTDSLNRQVVTTNNYAADRLSSAPVTTVNGLVSVTAASQYDFDNKEWKLDQTRWNYFGDEKYLYEKVNSTLSARGHLIFEDTIYHENKYQVNGQTYQEQNRRYIPEFDRDDNISRITEGVLVNGAFIPKQFTDYSDYGDFFAARNSLTTRIVDGQRIPYTSARLSTSPEEYWNTGKLNFQLTSRIYDDDSWVETRDKEGHVLGKIEQARDEDNHVIGERVTSFDPESFDVQNIPKKSSAVIRQNGHVISFSSSTDATSFNEAKLGLVRSQIDNHISGLASQELKDRRGRVIENPIGAIDPVTGKFKAQRKTVLYNLNDFDIARNSYTDSLLNGIWTRYTTSSLDTPSSTSEYDFIRQNKNIHFNVHNDFLSSASHSIDWQEVKNQRGNVIQLNKGYFDGNHVFHTTRKIVSTFKGVPSLIDVSDSTKTFMVVNGQELMVTDSSRLMTAHGVSIDENNINTVPVQDIFNAVHKVRYEGISHYKVIGQSASTTHDYQEIRNNLGNVEITLSGSKGTSGHFTSDRNEYRIYETEGVNKYGNFDIPTSTFATVGVQGHEEVASFSNNTHITNADRLLVYKTQKGIGLSGLTLGGDIFNNHKAFGRYLVKTDHKVKLLHPIESLLQIKDDKGREIVTFSGYPAFNPVTGFGTGSPTFVTTNTYDENLVSQPFATGSQTYFWSDGMAETGHTQGDVTPMHGIKSLMGYISDKKPVVLTTQTNLTFEKGAATYNTEDKREIGLRSTSLHLDGTLYRNFYLGSGIEGPAKFNLYYDRHELPAYGTEKLDNGKENPYALYRPTLFDYNGKPYVLIDEFVAPAKDKDGQFILKDKTPKTSILTYNGIIALVKGSSSTRTTPFSSILSLNDISKNSPIGKGLRAMLPETEAEKALDYGHQHSRDVTVKAYVDDISKNTVFEQQTWGKTVKKVAGTFGAIVGSMSTLYFFMIALRAFGFIRTASKSRGNQDANEVQQQDFEDMGFTTGQAHAILDERFNNGAFKDFEDFKTRLGSKLTNSHKLSERLFRKKIAENRLRVAIWHVSKFQFGSRNDAGTFNQADYDRLDASPSVKDFMAGLKDIYSLKPEQQASYESALKMFDKYLTTEQLSDIIASEHFQSLIGKYSKQRAVEVILKLMFKEIRDKEEYKNAIRERVDNIITSTGLDKEFPDQIFALKDTFLKNIENARLLPEGFQFHDFDVNTDLLAYSWDDLRKGPDMERQVRSNLVSVEKLFVFQVIFQRALFGLAGQGRAEEYLWAKYVYPSIHDSNALQDADILGKIKAFKQVFHVLMSDEVAGRLDNNRDPKGKVKYFQFIINEEIYNDAFRYFIGQKDPSLNDASWVLPDEVKNDVAPLKEHFESILDSINTVIGLPDDERRKAVKSIADQLKPVMLAFVGAVDKQVGMPVVKGRLTYWKLTIIPLLKMVTNGKMRQRIFSRGGPYNQTAHDMVRRLYHYAVIGLVTCLFAFLTVNMVTLLPFMALPYFFMMPWTMIATGAVSLLSAIFTPILKKFFVSSLNKSINSTDKAKKEKAIKSFGRRTKILYGIQAALFVASLIVTPFLNIPAQMIMIAPVIRWAIHFVPVLIFVDTWRLSFYAMNYLLTSMAEHGYYMTNNIYEIHNTSKPGQVVDRLMALFTDTAPAIGSVYKTRGQEKLDSFINNVDEMTSDEDGYFYADTKASDKTSQLTDVLAGIAANLSDQNGHNNPDSVAQLKKEIETFVAKVAKPMTIKGPDGTVFKARRFKTEWYNNLVTSFTGEERPALQKLIDYVNHNYRLDKGANPFSWDHIIPMTIAIIGYGEDWYFTNGELLDVNQVPGESQEFTHRLGMLARYKTELFLYMVNRLTAEGSNERAELLKMIDDPTYKPEGIQDWKIWPEITEWANRQLPTGYSNAITHKRTMKRLYTHHARMFNVPNPEAAADDKIRIIDRNLIAMHNLDQILGGKLREMVDVLIETNYRDTYIVYPDGTKRGVEDPYGMVDAKNPVGKYDSLMLKKLLGVIINERVFPVRLMGGGLNTDPLVNENYHAEKWNQKTAILPFLLGPVILNLDADHRSNYVDMEFVTHHLLEYNYLPGLATSTPIIKHTLTKGLGVYGDILPVSENAFYYHAQQGKELFGGLTATGKLFERVSALRHSEGVTDSYVAEDALTAINYRRFGYITGRAGSVKVEKGWPFSFSAALNPLRKWSYDSVESVSGRISMKVITSPFVDWTYLANNYWLDGFGFYLKKPGIPRYVRWLTAFYLILDWNLFSRIPMYLWLGSLGLSQAVSHGLFNYKIYDEGRGVVKGTISAFEHIATKMYVNFVHMIFVYDETVEKLASSRLGRFIKTASKSANQTRIQDKELNYVRSSYAIKSASILALVMAALVGISPEKAILWAPTLMMGFAGVAAPFLLNPVRIKNRLRDNLDNGKDIWVSFWWGLVDNVEGFQYRLSKIFPLARKVENDLQIKVLDMVNAYLPIPFGEIPGGDRAKIFNNIFGDAQGSVVLELTEYVYLFHQNPSHSRNMYGRAVLPAIFKLISILAKKTDGRPDYTKKGTNDGSVEYKKDLIARLSTVKEYLEALKKVDSLKDQIARAENKQLQEVEDILINNTKTATPKQLDEADRLLTELSWLPLNIQSRGAIRSSIANKVFGMIGVDAIFQALSFYTMFPLLFIWDKLFNSNAIDKDLKDAMNMPQSTVVPLNPSPARDNAMVSADVFKSMVQPVFDDPSVVTAQQIVNIIPIEGAMKIAGHGPDKLGGIDLGRAVVDVRSSGDFIQTAFDDPAILRLLLNSDGLTPIIYKVKPMTSAMVDQFVGLN